MAYTPDDYIHSAQTLIELQSFISAPDSITSPNHAMGQLMVPNQTSRFAESD